MFNFLSKKSKNDVKPDPKDDENSLGNMLLDASMISEEQLQFALKYQEDKQIRLGESLVELGFVEQGIVDAILVAQASKRGEYDSVEIIRFATNQTKRVMDLKDEVAVACSNLVLDKKAG